LKKTIISLALSTGLLLTISGCAGIESGTAIKDAPTQLKKVNKVVQAPKYLLDNGKLVSDNGTILDEEGDIVDVYNLSNGKSFYLLKIIGKDLYKIKTIEKQTIKEFNANDIKSFHGDDKIVLAVKLAKNRTSIYDNIYLYDGNKLSLINKNIDLSNSYPTGLSALKSVYDRASSYYFIKYQKLSNMITGQKIYNKKIPTKYRAKRKPIIIGSRGNKVFYTYAVSGGMYYTFFIEAYDIKTKKTYTLVSGRTEPEIEILRAGNKAILKILKPTRFIDLNNLEEVKGINGKFKSVLPKMGIMEFRDNLVKLSHHRKVRPLF